MADPHQTTTVTLPTPEETVHLTDIQQYLLEEHKSQFTTGEVTAAQFPWMSFDAQGNPTLRGDIALQEQRGLPDYVKAIQTQAGEIHEAYMPEMATTGWATQDTAHAVEA